MTPHSKLRQPAHAGGAATSSPPRDPLHPRRRAAAYHGLGRLQEALRDYEAADAAAEAAEEWAPKRTIAK